jgi:hypothetical protein
VTAEPVYETDQPDPVEPLRVAQPVVDTEGLHDLTNEQYQRDPVPGGSISSSALKVILQKSPAHAREYQLNGRPPKGHYDVGSAVHTHMLGGAPIVFWGKGDGQDKWTTNDAKQFKKDAYAAKQIPLLKDQEKAVLGMVASLRRRSDVGAWLEPGGFIAEQSGFWIDPVTGLWCRFRTDAVPHYDDGGEMVVVDLKTGYDVSPDGIARAIASCRYDLQKAHYVAGLQRLMDVDLIRPAEITYVLAFVEKDPPYDTVVRRIGPRTTAHAERHRRDALELFRECRELDEWPGYDDPELRSEDDIPEVEAPYWQLKRWDDEVDPFHHTDDEDDEF